MTGYTKLFNSILTSSVWCGQDPETKVVWITMLAMANKNGIVEATAPGIAKLSEVPLEKVEDVLTKLSKLDPVSRSLDNGGARLTRLDNGYTLVNYKKYRNMRDADARKEYMRNYMRDYMSKRRKAEKVKPQLNQVKPHLAQAEADITYTLVRKEGVVGGGNQSSINPQSQEKQKPKTKLKECPVPGCRNLCPAGELYCSDLHKQWAENELNRGKA